MRKILLIVSCAFLLTAGTSVLADGGGRVTVGYTYIDEEGNQSVNHGTFNQYEGVGLSLEKFNYLFDSGLRLKADLNNLTLNNRNAVIGLERSGLFGFRAYNNQYRRVYNFEGDSFTRRHNTGGTVWFYPHRYIRLFGGGEYVGNSGKMLPLFDLGGATPPQDVDYKQFCYNAGIRLNHRGGMFQAEYRAGEYHDDFKIERDQTRSRINLYGLIPVPGYEWLVLSGRFFHFETKYDDTEFKISTNQVRGGAMAKLSEKVLLNYYFIFDRTSSDSDIIATDNIAHAVYATYNWMNVAGLTAGYQYGINDDYEAQVTSNAYYFYGWLKPGRYFELRGEHGMRSESVDDGSRLIGDEDRSRFKFSAKYSKPENGFISIKYEGRNRENEQLGTEIDFTRLAIDAALIRKDYGNLSAGYAYSIGDYDNLETAFEFADHIVYGDITSAEYRGFDAGFGVVYYRSLRDLDVESFSLHFKAGYNFMEDHRLEVKYNVDNFDDFLVRDNYYTSNIVEISLTKILSF
ncbi:MAG: hypothetical protein CVT49_04655 [candidate division Zixibacteria bacterium HGW-Zixibacteria-1]|nr:MAG: hypothetical protein CVT49_04655 [candidate division Zixibacteria bacterium HGW-Zixibacteria-1]